MNAGHEGALTGRARPRLGFFGRIVMQVEVLRYDRTYLLFTVRPPPRRSGLHPVWEDARPEHFISGTFNISNLHTTAQEGA